MTEGIKEYIEEVTTGIKCRGKYKKKIEDELSVHMETLYSDFLDRGYDIKRILQSSAKRDRRGCMY